MAKVISIAIQKGGTAKTTTTVTTAHALGELGKKILVLDMDPQHNASMILGKIPPYEQPTTVIDLFIDQEATFKTCIVKSKYKNVDLIPSNIELFGVTGKIGYDNPKQFIGLKNKLDHEPDICKYYDYILLDCPPAIGGIFLNNALTISNGYIIPLEAESIFALKGIQQFMECVNAIKSTINPKLELFGVLITMANLRNTTTQLIMKAVKEASLFGSDKIFSSIIRNNTTINKAALLQQTVIGFNENAQGTKDYRKFARELVTWLEEKNCH